MYKTLSETPSSTLQEKYGMTVREEDSYTDYRIDLAGRSQDELAEIAELFDVDKNELSTNDVLTLSVLVS